MAAVQPRTAMVQITNDPEGASTDSQTSLTKTDDKSWPVIQSCSPRAAGPERVSCGAMVGVACGSMTHGHTAPQHLECVNTREAVGGALEAVVLTCMGQGRQARVHAVGTTSEWAAMLGTMHDGSRSRFSAPPMKRRDTFQSERPAEDDVSRVCMWSGVVVMLVMCCQKESDRLSRWDALFVRCGYTSTHTLCICRRRVDMCIYKRCAKLVTRTAACSG